MVLQAMIQRLYRAVMRGPGLNARPHSSRQRIDILELAALGDGTPRLNSLLESGSWSAKATIKAPLDPGDREGQERWQRQLGVVRKLHRIASDARDYAQDHGESALALGFPLLSIPPSKIRGSSSRVLAPLAFVPIQLGIISKLQPTVTLSTTGEGSDLLEPNPSLLAFIEHVTSHPFNIDEAMANDLPPWEELDGLTRCIAEALGGLALTPLHAESALHPVPRTDDLPDEPTLLPSAVLGLFPTRNLQLLRDTQWMAENEATLPHPVVSFLDPRATAAPRSREARPKDPLPEPHIDPSNEHLITDADPCQRHAVDLAQRAPALVVHGPPGTGKSQSIANIIGDHLARGERVLFVCEKRTALDVVKHRLDALGLGHLCGVIHDPVSDRRSFYLALRKRLENLATAPVLANPKRTLNQLNETLTETHAFLSACYDALHQPHEDAESFHTLVGQWLALSNEAERAHEGTPPRVEGSFLPEALEKHRLTVEEALNRAGRLQWQHNPWRHHPPGPLEAILAESPEFWHRHLQTGLEQAASIDAPLAFDPIFPTDHILTWEAFPSVADALQSIHDHLLQVLGAAEEALLVTYADADAETLAAWRDQAARMHGDAQTLTESPLRQEWLLTANQDELTLAKVNECLLAISRWRDSQGLRKLWRFLKAGEARAALAPMGLTLSDAHADQALAFYQGLQQRLALKSALEMDITAAPVGWLGDDALARHWHTRLQLTEAFQKLGPDQPAHPWRGLVVDSCRSGSQALAAWLPRLLASSQRLQAAYHWSQTLGDTGLFSRACWDAWAERALSKEPFTPPLKKLLHSHHQLEDASRLESCFQDHLPKALSDAIRELAAAGHGYEAALPVLTRHALSEALRERIDQSPTLQAMDGERVEAAFHTLVEATEKKQEAAQRQAAYHWQKHQREKLLASTGSRLGPEGTALRQRLYLRGTKALKLRQMIAAGGDSPESDPLFDLCPVWMAGPSTVAQILPREAIFDSVVFDEASQCRLEEALPVLLRGKRVVVAGDPKQLPPSRFFEAAITDTEHLEAETAEELFEQRQAETEDLLTAALNLSVDEAHLDVHYRSQHHGLIAFSNKAFYESRLQAVPAHPSKRPHALPIDLRRVDGCFEDRCNRKEAERAVDVVTDLLDSKHPPSIGIACFNLPQHDLINDLLEERAAEDKVFANRYATARGLRREDAFEGLFVKNLENVQGDERDVIIISTGFGPDAEGHFRRHFGVLNRSGGGRRLNVLVTRARQRVIILTSIPRREYVSLPPRQGEAEPNGRYYLYQYLQFAEQFATQWRETEAERLSSRPGETDAAACLIGETAWTSPLPQALGEALLYRHAIGSFVHWGNDGFRVDTALRAAHDPNLVTKGILTDFSRYRATRDPIAWDLFRSQIFQAQGWDLERLWSPALFRRLESCLQRLAEQHQEACRR